MTRPLVALLDYGAGNLPSARRGLERAGADVIVAATPTEVARADAVVVPGVGHVGRCLADLRASGLADLVAGWVGEHRPLLGICVGMQLLYEHSEEGDTAGLGLLPGRVVRLPATVRVPHIGWNLLRAAELGHDALLDGVAGERAYFVHSYHPVGDGPEVAATCTYGTTFPALVASGSITATQFHPEKSGAVGHRLLGNWLAGVAAAIAPVR